ncbi:MAG: histidine kinase [Rhodanobacteraceae bacterium]|nr:histidine kinase [Rhodanobacteraceae bacterium]
MSEMPRGWVWVQIALAWLPMWAVFTVLISSAHDISVLPAMIGSARMVVPGALLGFAVYAFTNRTPWPHPFRLRFVVVHMFAATIYAVVWLTLIVAIDYLVSRRMVVREGPGIVAFLVTGMWLYLVVAGVAYANRAAQRAAALEAHAARVQLAQLRAQLHPHFLFNTLHTIVQLIPTAPQAASQAAEELADVLRRVIEEDRDLLPLSEELAFVERYLAIERLRFGERLRVERQVDAAALPALVPSFALQTLIENAVRHGAAAKLETTTIAIRASLAGGVLTLSVHDDGVGARSDEIMRAGSTGLRRLRERLQWEFGEHSRLDIDSSPGAGFAATLHLPALLDEAVQA